ncbi:histidine kinase [Winogradskyella sp.]|uniref:sensor histidine kinase n=1 Tax=Winogradskyella sp. TaxID=1883156 RepID=UPI003BAC5A91
MHYMLRFLIFLLISLCLLLLNCSQGDSEQELRNTIDSVLTYQEKAKTNSADSTLTYLRIADQIILNNNNIPDSIVIEHMFLKGLYFYDAKQLDSAAYYFHNTVNRVDLSNISPRAIDYFKKTLATDLETENSLPNGISTANKFIEGLLKTKDYDNLIYPYNFLDRAHRLIGDYKKALYYNEKALEAAELSGNKNVSAITAVSRSNLLYGLNKKAEAYQLLDSILENKNAYSNDARRQLFTNYGILNYYDADFKNAVINYKEALFYLKKETAHPEYYYFLVESYVNLSEAYMELEDYNRSEAYLDSASMYMNEDFRIDNLIFLGEQKLKLSYLTKKNIANILSEYDTLVKIQNEFYKQKINDELLALELEYENGRVLAAKNRANEKKNEQLRFAFIVVILVTPLIIIIVYLLYRQRRYRFKNLSLQMQQRLLRSQMNPHFTFNTLYAIQNELKKDPESAKDYMLKFSRLLRLILENSTQNYVQLNKELDSLKQYMDLQLLRSPSKFNYHISLENMVEDDLIFIPPMLIQPFIENSIEHGFSHIDYKGDIQIHLALEGAYILCRITDNGNGHHTSDIADKESISTGLISEFILKTTKTKIKFINRTEATPKDSGMIIEFLIPYKPTEDD